jgi:hypothetical protein
MDNRRRFRHLLEIHHITQKESAKLISAVTGRPCSERAVRTWVGDPAKRSTSPCPDYAVRALEKAIEYMEQAMARRSSEESPVKQN